MGHGRVASVSIHRAIKAKFQDGFRIPMYHLHIMNQILLDEQDKLGNRVRDILLGKSLRCTYDSLGEFFRWKFISGVREPIATAISATYHIEKKEMDKEEVYEKVEEVIPYYINYFDNMFLDSFGIDVYKGEFNHKEGYCIVRSDNIDLFIYKFESLSDKLVNVMADFLNLSDLNVPRVNMAIEKEYGKNYNTIRETLKFDKNFLDSVYDSKHVKHFYTEKEIKVFYNRWSADFNK
jgi:hypothetical protein